MAATLSLWLHSLAVLGGGATAVPRAWDARSACSRLASTLQLDSALENATVSAVAHLAAGTNLTIPEPELACEDAWYVTEAAVCTVQVDVRTSDDSRIRLEAWLPDEWHGRYLGTGNGGLAGCTRWTDLNHGSYYHFATVSTDAGHRGDTGLPFFQHPEVLKDFVYRDIAVEAAIGKAITAAYYGRPIGKSYYTGCSAGGRQAFRAIQQFPDIFDGVVAGAPATDWNHLMSAGARVGKIVGLTGNNEGLLSDEDLDLVTKDVLDQCDGLDGVVDGIIDDPDLCQYQPEALLCDAGAGENACLTVEKVEAVRQLFLPLYGEKGELLFPRYDPGMTASTPRYLFGPDLYSYPLDWFRYAIYNDTSYSTANFSLADVTLADELDPSGVSTYDPNIESFVNRGGKILTFHGTQDELIPSGNTLRYYNLVASALNLSTQDPLPFYRHFQIPGMSHCSRGPAAWQMAQSGTAIAGLQNDTDKNVLLTMVEWVEGGTAPDTLVGTRFVNDTPALGVQRMRTYCAWPRKSVWDGSGPLGEAESWACR